MQGQEPAPGRDRPCRTSAGTAHRGHHWELAQEGVSPPDAGPLPAEPVQAPVSRPRWTQRLGAQQAQAQALALVPGPGLALRGWAQTRPPRRQGRRRERCSSGGCAARPPPPAGRPASPASAPRSPRPPPATGWTARCRARHGGRARLPSAGAIRACRNRRWPRRPGLRSRARSCCALCSRKRNPAPPGCAEAWTEGLPSIGFAAWWLPLTTGSRSKFDRLGCLLEASRNVSSPTRRQRAVACHELFGHRGLAGVVPAVLVDRQQLAVDLLMVRLFQQRGLKHATRARQISIFQ